MPRVSKEWPTDVTKRLIDEYKNRPEMWDMENTYYSNRQKQQENFRQLAKILKKNELDVKNKIRGLRATFFKELTAKRLSLSQTYKSKWEFYNDLKFIKANCSTKQNHITNHLASRSCSESEGKEADHLPIKYQPESVVDEEEDNVLPSPSTTQRTLDVPQPVPETINVDASKIVPHHQEIPLQERCNRCVASIDECQHFGNFVASEMRDMPLSQRRSFKNEVLRSILHHNPT